MKELKKPWRVTPAAIDNGCLIQAPIIVTAEGQRITGVDWPLELKTPEEAQTLAEQIVKASNWHDELVHLIKRANQALLMQTGNAIDDVLEYVPKGLTFEIFTENVMTDLNNLLEMVENGELPNSPSECD